MSELYVELEKELEHLGPSCVACGACCRFAEYDHEMWLTNLELAYLLGKHGLRRETQKGVCPYLEDDQCTAREGRALGCRVFFCSLPSDFPADLSERYLERLKAIAKEEGVELLYGELLASLRKL